MWFFSRTIQIDRLIPLIVLLVILAGLPTLVVSDTGPSPIDGNPLGNEIITSQTEASNSSASAVITITMYAVADESPS